MLHFVDVLRNPDGKIPTHQMWYWIEPSPISGCPLAELQITRLTGCTVLAIRRGGRIIWAPEGSMPMLDGDEIYISGTNAQLALFERAFGLPRLQAPTNHAAIRRMVA